MLRARRCGAALTRKRNSNAVHFVPAHSHRRCARFVKPGHPAFCASALSSTVRQPCQAGSSHISRRCGNIDTAPRLAKLGHSAFCACMVSSMVRPSCQVESSFISRQCGVIGAAVRCTETTPLYPALAQWQPISLARPRLAYAAPFVCAGGRRTS